jgi:Flp pilus assembly protein protease CpaA
MLLLSLYMAILILITVIDLEHRLVLNRVILPAIVLALIAGLVTPGLSILQALIGGLVGFGVFYLIAMVYPGGMGAGDVKLAAFIGLITGFPNIVLAIILTIFAGGLISLLLVVTRVRTMRDYIPYGPFLVIGGILTLFWGQPIMDDYMDRGEEVETAARTGTQVCSAEPYDAQDWSWDTTVSGAGISPPLSRRQLYVTQHLSKLFKGDSRQRFGAGHTKGIGQQGHLGSNLGIWRFKNV